MSINDPSEVGRTKTGLVSRPSIYFLPFTLIAWHGMASKQAKVLCDHHVQGRLASASRYPGRNRATERCNWLTKYSFLSS
jgi:hypothetical protein